MHEKTKAAMAELVPLVAMGSTVVDAVRQVDGITVETARKHLKEPEWQELLAELRNEKIAVVFGLLIRDIQTAQETLLACMGDNQPGSVRVQAANAYLRNVAQVNNSLEFRERLKRVEKLLVNPSAGGSDDASEDVDGKGEGRP